jgi:hypothetical protein
VVVDGLYRRFIRKLYAMIELLIIVGERKLLKRKIGILLLGLVAAGLLVIELISRSRIVEVSARQWTGLWSPMDVAIGDYNNDGLNDIAIGEYNGNKITVYKSDGTTVIKQWTGLINPEGVAIGDYNNDGLNDIAFTELNAGKVTVYYQTKLPTVARVAEPTIVTLHGTLTYATNGYPILNGSIRVTIKDSMGTQVWQDTFDNVIDNGKYDIPLGAKTTLILIKGQIYSAILEVDADSLTFVSADVIYGDNNPAGDIIKFVAN